MASPLVNNSPVANRESKQDKLTVTRLALASFDPQQTASLSEPLAAGLCVRRARRHPDAEALRPDDGAASAGAAEAEGFAAKPALQKAYTLLSDEQIAGIKERLRLSSDQEYYWPAVETALRAVARKIHASRHGDQRASRRAADRSRRRRSAAAEIRGDAAVVPAARRPEAGSALARPPDRPGKSRRADLANFQFSIETARACHRARSRHPLKQAALVQHRDDSTKPIRLQGSAFGARKHPIPVPRAMRVYCLSVAAFFLAAAMDEPGLTARISCGAIGEPRPVHGSQPDRL